jgi:hypothetical protein
MSQRRTSLTRIAGYALLASGLAWLAWVCVLGFALRDGIAQRAVDPSSWGNLQAFVADAWHMLLFGVLAALTGLLIVWRTGRDT